MALSHTLHTPRLAWSTLPCKALEVSIDMACHGMRLARCEKCDEDAVTCATLGIVVYPRVLATLSQNRDANTSLLPNSAYLRCRPILQRCYETKPHCQWQ